MSREHLSLWIPTFRWKFPKINTDFTLSQINFPSRSNWNRGWVIDMFKYKFRFRFERQLLHVMWCTCGALEGKEWAGNVFCCGVW